MAGYVASNLTYGSRRLRIGGRLAGTDFEKTLLGVVQNFDKAIRNEVLNDASVMLQQRAIGYIREGKLISKVPANNPRSYGLERAISTHLKSNETDKAVLDLSDIPYAALHNAPLGSYTVVGADKYMAFYWYKAGFYRRVYGEGVRKPGTGFLDRAVEDVRKALPRITDNAIKFFREQGDLSISPTTGARLRGPAKLIGAQNRLRRFK